jgi:phage terminase small subunit
VSPPSLLHAVSPDLFVHHYLACLDAYEALRLAIIDQFPDPRAVMARTNEAEMIEAGEKLLRRPEVMREVSDKLSLLYQNQQTVNAQFVLEQTRVVYEKCMQIAPIHDSRGEMVIGPFQPAPALRALELMGKHVDVRAFREVLELDVGANLLSALTEARKRLEERRDAVTLTQDPIYE